MLSRTNKTEEFQSLHRTATHCNILQHRTATYCNTALQHTATPHCNILHQLMLSRTKTFLESNGGELVTAPHCNALQHSTTYCNALQHTARKPSSHPTGVEHTATHGNTLQHTATHLAIQRLSNPSTTYHRISKLAHI